jgi:alpha-glucosidase
MRYQLLQVFYDFMYENTQNGLPICRALFLNEPNDINVFTYADQQFFLGKDILVAPVTDQNWDKDVYLPSSNNWYVFDVNGGALPEPTLGGKVYPWYVPLDLVPVYVREGAILPIRQLTQYVDAENPNYLNFYIYPTSKDVGDVTTYQLYQDDKVSTDFEKDEGGKYRVTEISATKTSGGRSVQFENTYGYDVYTPLEDHFYVSFLGITAAPSSVTVNGTLLTADAQNNVESGTTNGYYYDSNNQKIVVKVYDSAKDVSIEYTA